MPTTIKLKNSVTTTNVPSSLAQGEVAINVTDKKVWVGNAATTPVQLLGGGADGSFTNISVSSVATFGAGTVSLPSITTTGDTNTGIFFPAADTIAFSEGGTESMRIDSSGNLGIGTSSPSANGKLTLSSSGSSNYQTIIAGSNTSLVGTDSNGLALSALGANNVVCYTAGSERMRIDTSGNVGIGTSSPAVKLQVSSSTAADGAIARLELTNTSVFGGDKYGQLQFFGNDSSSTASGIRAYVNGDATGSNGEAAIVFGTADTNAAVAERMRIDSAGNVGIGNTIPFNSASYSSLTIGGLGSSKRGLIELKHSDNNARGYLYVTADQFLTLETSGAYPLLFSTNGADRMRIDSTGNVIIAGTSQRSAGRLSIDINPAANNGISFYPTTNTGIDACRFLNNAGSIVGVISSSASSTNYGTSSDYRLKEDIAPMTGALARVVQLKPVTYKWKIDGSDGQGFIAHELQAVVPDCVIGEKDAVDAEGNPKYQGIDTSFLVATLTAAIQELKAIVDAQAIKITALENK
jgi:hypothetical protein